MKIAICCETEDAGGLVAKDFKSSPFLLMIDSEKNVIYHVYGKQDPENLVFAEKIAAENCEAVICGPIEKEAFEKIAGAGVSRFDGSGHKAQRAYVSFLRNKLPLIRDYIGGPGPVGHSHDLSCDCGEDEHDHEGNDHPTPEQIAQEAAARLRREDTLFMLSEEDADVLPDEIEIPDGLSREEMEAYLKNLVEDSMQAGSGE